MLGASQVRFGRSLALLTGYHSAVARRTAEGKAAREREVLELVAQGRANAAIAARLGLSHKTIHNHVSNILTKLQLADRAQAIVQARDAGLGHQSRT